MPHPLETYLHDLYATHSSGAGVDELSYYLPLANLLNEIGKSLKPRVRFVNILGNQGAGHRPFASPERTISGYA